MTTQGTLILNTETAVPPYQSTPKHRSAVPGSSQWSISPRDEVGCFEFSARSGWLQGDRGVGIHVVDGRASTLGIARGNPSFIAVFRGGKKWHGYPEDSRFVRVPATVTATWYAANYIRLRTVRCLMRGQQCSP